MSSDDIDERLKKLDEFLNSEEGKKSIQEFVDSQKREQDMLEGWLYRFHNRFYQRFPEIVEKVIAKYEDDKYVKRWYSRSIEPPCDLYWFLYHYAEKFGRECQKQEWDEIGNMFTSSLHYVNGYYFQRMDGQGSVIKITKKT